MKKLLALCLFASLSFTFVACAGECADKDKGEGWCHGNTLYTCTGDEDPKETDCEKEASFNLGSLASGQGVCKETSTTVNGTTKTAATCTVDNIQIGK